MAHLLPMPNRFNYRCPKCGSADDVVIEAYVAVWLDDNRARVIEQDKDDIKPDRWYSAGTNERPIFVA